jgi:hypothetical protein
MARHLLDKNPTVNLDNASLEDLAGVPGFEDADVVEYVRGQAELS